MFKVATWNINSLRVRLSHILSWLAEHQPDVLALQETKLIDADFPVAEFRHLGYNVVFIGQKTYNGVAIIAKQTPSELQYELPNFLDPQRRLLAATCGDIRVINVYIPNGESIVSDKYQYKLAWLTALQGYLHEQLISYPRLILLGDYNIAPAEADVCDPTAWQNSVLVSPLERDAFKQLLDLGLSDVFRKFSQAPASYSWWDYRAAAFRRNLGLRIDHILASEPLAQRCIACYIDKQPRALERPSDHTPVVASFDMSI
jgi:exodeoxyribonuclease-3